MTGCRRWRHSRHSVVVQQADCAIRVDAIARDGMTIRVGGVGIVPIVGDDHPAGSNQMVGHRAVNHLDSSMRQAIGRHRPGAVGAAKAIGDDELVLWAGKVKGHPKGIGSRGWEGSWPAQAAIVVDAIHVNEVGCLLSDQQQSTGRVNLDLGGIGMGSAQRSGGSGDRMQVPLIIHMEASHVGCL